MPPRCIGTAEGPLDADFAAPPSKSATHRALVAAAVADGVSTIVGPLDADDTRRTRDALRALGVRVDAGAGAWTVHGAAGSIRGGGTIDVGESGTTARFLLAIAAVGSRPSTVDGTPRLRERPMEDLIAALRSLGAVIEPGSARALPVRAGGGRVAGGAIAVSGVRSSQFTSALLLAAPMFDRGLALTVAGPRVSPSYVRMTVEMLEAFGGRVSDDGAGSYRVPACRLRAATVEVEGDYSSASYAMAAAAILGGRVRVRGLRRGSLQPDARFSRDLASLGCAVAFEENAVSVVGDGRIPPFAWSLAGAPDLAPAAAVLALFAEGPCSLSGLHHLHAKESDRPAALAENLERFGARAVVADGTLMIDPPARHGRRAVAVDSHGDHRIAMAFAVAGLAVPGVTIDRADVVEKSYPGFWTDLEALVRTGS